MISAIPRPEYPRPQMVRDEWMNLNGEWGFETDHGKSGRERKLFEAAKFKDKIIVPFCPESRLSKIGIKDFMPSVWYRRQVEIPQKWLSGTIRLHFGAADYFTEVWINGKQAGTHKGGYSSFSFDITELVVPGTNTITAAVDDDTRSGLQPSGKQSDRYDSYACMYTRTTGIWQTVWLECIPVAHISYFRLIPDTDNSCLLVEAYFRGTSEGCTLAAKTSYNGKDTGEKKVNVSGGHMRFIVELSKLHLWEPGRGRLYDLELVLYRGDERADKVKSYFGMRSIEMKNNVSMLNGKPLFQRLVLDQGFYPDGIYTAPSDADLKKDIEIAMGMGFNGARLHEKIFEPRYLYWADRLGFLIWGEHANWGLDVSEASAIEAFLPEWSEAIDRDFSHPSVIGWCPFNETQVNQDDEIIRLVYDITKQKDPTRIVIDTSGWRHVITDMLDVHDYDQDPGSFAKRYEPLKNGQGIEDQYKRNGNIKDLSKVNFVSEYGGIWWNDESDDGWGYGQRPKTRDEFLDRYEALTKSLLDNPKICAFCYTQLYDVEQERNGLYTYDRKPKFDDEQIKKINSRRAAVEKEIQA